MRGWAAAFIVVFGALTARVDAQPATPPAPAAPYVHRLLVSAGVNAGGGHALGDQNADLRRNSTVSPPPSFTLFHADSTLERAAGVEARVGYAVTRLVAVEVGGSYARPRLAVTITGDAEAGGSVVVAEQVAQYTIDISGVLQLPWRRAAPYMIGGAGYLRQLHEGRLLVETGHTVQVGGGVRYWLSGWSGRGHAFGVRGEARFVRRSGGIDFDDRSRTYPVVSVLGVFGF